MTVAIARIPVLLLTGFLGSGKTTLLQRWLPSPAFAGTAVIVNEIGAIGLDQVLLRSSTETMRVLENGCVCCTVRDDLAATLADLFWDRLHRRVPRFGRVVIETTGLAVPAPVIEAMRGDVLVKERYALERVICTVDATVGEERLEGRPEAVAQASAADVLLVTKRDLASAERIERLCAKLATCNPFAALHVIAHGDIEPATALARPRRPWRGALAGARESVVPMNASPHGDDVHTFALRCAPVRKDALVGALNASIARHGGDLLRIKGMLTIVDEGRRVVQVAGGALGPLVPAPRAADDDATGFLIAVIAARDPRVAYEIEADIRAAIAAAALPPSDAAR